MMRFSSSSGFQIAVLVFSPATFPGFSFFAARSLLCRAAVFVELALQFLSMLICPALNAVEHLAARKPDNSLSAGVGGDQR